MQLSKQVIWLSLCCSSTALAAAALPVLQGNTKLEHRSVPAAQSLLQQHSWYCRGTAVVQPVFFCVLQWHSLCYCSTAHVAVVQAVLQQYSLCYSCSVQIKAALF